MKADIIKLLKISVDGDIFIGKGFIKEPDLKFGTETDENDFIRVDQITNLEAMSSELTLHKVAPEVLKQVGICSNSRKRIVGTASFEDDFCIPKAYKIVLEGIFTEIKGIEIKPGIKADRSFTLGSISYYRLEYGGEVIWEIDRDRHVFIVHGFDQMAIHRLNARII